MQYGWYIKDMMWKLRVQIPMTGFSHESSAVRNNAMMSANENECEQCMGNIKANKKKIQHPTELDEARGSMNMYLQLLHWLSANEPTYLRNPLIPDVSHYFNTISFRFGKLI
jgi:hypothetical protein